jgi:choice-of-anchor A domain-containing protein
MTAPNSLSSARRLAVCAASSLVAWVASSGAVQAGLLQDWNLIVRNSVQSTSEVDGSALVGGNVTGASNYAVQGVTSPDGTGLAVGGNVGPGPISINHGGNLRLTGSKLGPVNLNGGGSLIADPTIPATVAAQFAYLEGLSTALETLPANGILDGAGNMNAAPTFLDGQWVAVYNLTAASLAGLGQLNLNMGIANTVIINVAANGSGAVNFTAPPNMIGGFNQGNSTRILWNLYDATLVTVNNSFNGSLLAPYADLKLLGGGINGTVAVDSVSAQNAEVRRFTYTGYLPEVPEPSSYVLAVGGALSLLGYGALRRRRQA